MYYFDFTFQDTFLPQKHALRRRNRNLVVVKTFDSSMQEGEAGRFLWGWCQPGQHIKSQDSQGYIKEKEKKEKEQEQKQKQQKKIMMMMISQWPH